MRPHFVINNATLTQIISGLVKQNGQKKIRTILPKITTHACTIYLQGGMKFATQILPLLN